MTITDPADDQLAAITNPAKLLRLGSMAKQLLEEIHRLPLDDLGRERLVATHAEAVAELEAMLPEQLRHELTTIAPHLRIGTAVSDAELRIAHAQLVGWLEGLFQGTQFAAALQMADDGSRR